MRVGVLSRRLSLVGVVAALALALAAPPAASASARSPWWQLITGARPTNLWLGQEAGRLVITLTNLGDAPLDATGTPLTVTDRLPAGISAYDAEGVAGFSSSREFLTCAVQTSAFAECSFSGTIEPYESIEVEVYVAVRRTHPGEGEVSVSGGNAPSVSTAQKLTVSEEKTPFGLQTFIAQAEDEGGAPATRAGSHPFQFTNTIQLNQGPVTGANTSDPAEKEITESPGLARNLRFVLPAGLIGNATAVPKCSEADFFAIAEARNQCSPATVVGVATPTIDDYFAFGVARAPTPVFNLPPGHGEPARFGFVALGYPVVIDTSLETEGGYRILASVSNTTQVVHFLASTVTLWGNPNDPRHDASRGWGCTSPSAGLGCSRPADLKETPFLRMPVSCGSALDYPMEMEPWSVPLGSDIVHDEFKSVALDSCNEVPFDPTVAAAPTSKLAENPSGLSFELEMPNSGLLNPADGAIAEGQPKKVEVTLPEGVTVNPSEAEGLVPCTRGRLCAARRRPPSRAKVARKPRRSAT